VLNNLKLIAASHRDSLASFFAAHVCWRNLFQNFRYRLRRHEQNIVLRVDERLGQFN
jgi:hypothetical protein